MAKTKALISFAVTAKLICIFVFAYEKSRFSHDAAQIAMFKSNDSHTIEYCSTSKFVLNTIENVYTVCLHHEEVGLVAKLNI